MTARGSRGKGGRGGSEIIKKARILAETEGTIVKVIEFAERDADAASKQLSPDLFADLIASGEVVRPLYDPLLWSYLLEQNTRLNRCIWATALNTVGLGWELPAKVDEKKFIRQNRVEMEAERARVSPLLEHPNDDMSFEELCTQIKVDEEAMGNGYMEVGRDLKGMVAALYHAPGHTIRVLSSGNGYLQMRTILGSDSFALVQPNSSKDRTAQKVYFKKFGEKRVMNKNTGEFVEGREASKLPLVDQANELIQFRLYTPRSSFYGIPRFVSAAPAISGSRLAQLRNVAFFENDSVPRMAIIVQGGRLDAESVKMIENFVNVRGKGPMNSGRTMILQAAPKEGVRDDSAKATITLMPLTVGSQDDSSFTRYIAQNNEEVREAFGMGVIFLGTATDVNRATALAAKQITMEQVFEPEARRYEYRLNNTILRAMGADKIRLKFRRTKIVDLAQEAAAYAQLAAAGGITPNDIRDLMEADRFRGAWADTPLSVLGLGLTEPSDEEAVGPEGPPQEGAAPGGQPGEPGGPGVPQSSGSGPLPAPHIVEAMIKKAERQISEFTGQEISLRLVGVAEPGELRVVAEQTGFLKEKKKT